MGLHPLGEVEKAGKKIERRAGPGKKAPCPALDREADEE